MKDEEQYYEISYLVDGGLTGEEATNLELEVQTELVRDGATIDSADSPRKRALAYPILGQSEVWAAAVRFTAPRVKTSQLKQTFQSRKTVLRSLMLEWKKPQEPMRKPVHTKTLLESEEPLPSDERELDQKLEEILGTTFHESQ